MHHQLPHLPMGEEVGHWVGAVGPRVGVWVGAVGARVGVLVGAVGWRVGVWHATRDGGVR